MDEVSARVAQIAALKTLSGLMTDGYGVVENGLDGVGRVHGEEYSLHQFYFGGLAIVSPVVAGMPEVSDIVTREEAIVSGFGAAIARWRVAGGLTASEMDMVEGVYARMCGLGAEELGELKDLLTGGVLVMTDAERMRRVRGVDEEVRREWEVMEGFGRGVELSLLNRQRQSP